VLDDSQVLLHTSIIGLGIQKDCIVAELVEQLNLCVRRVDLVRVTCSARVYDQRTVNIRKQIFWSKCLFTRGVKIVVNKEQRTKNKEQRTDTCVSPKERPCFLIQSDVERPRNCWTALLISLLVVASLGGSRGSKNVNT